MNPWWLALYPLALGYLAWLVRPRPESDAQPRHLLARLLQSLLSGVALLLALASTIVIIIGPAWFLSEWLHWPFGRAWPVGVLLGLVLFLAWIAWLVAGLEHGGTAGHARRAAEAGEHLISFGIPILIVVGQFIAVGVGWLCAGFAASRFLAHVNWGSQVEEFITNTVGIVGGGLLMVAYFLGLHWWQERSTAPSNAQ